MEFAVITASAVYLAAPWSAARAQNTTYNSATARPAAGVAQASPPSPGGVSQGPGASQAPSLPYGAGEVVKMYQGGINKDVIVNYVNSTALPYHLNADGIIYLQTLGMPQEITKAMIVRDGQLQQQQANQQAYQQPIYQQQPMPGAMPGPYGPYGNAAAQPPVQVVTPTTSAPDVTVIGSDYPYYGYGYPYYSYGWPYYGYYGYGWPWGIGWGWGWGHGGYRGGYGGYRGGYGGYHGGVGGFHGGVGVGGFHGGGISHGVGGFGGGGVSHSVGGGGRGGGHR